MNLASDGGEDIGSERQGGATKHGFFFLANHRALDFVNTRPLLDARRVELLPDFPAVLRWFHAAGWVSARKRGALQRRWGDSDRARRTVAVMRRLREGLRRAVWEWKHRKPVRKATRAELNRLLARHPMLTRMDPSDGRTELWFEAQEPEDLFAPLAHAAATLFALADRDRVRQCAGCVGHFLDVSKKGTRRWCSMQLCGNRAKVAAYAARQWRRGTSPKGAGKIENPRRTRRSPR